MAKERTWLTVVAGIGVDLLIAYPAGWWTILFVISASSLGIIARSLINEHRDEREELDARKSEIEKHLDLGN